MAIRFRAALAGYFFLTVVALAFNASTPQTAYAQWWRDRDGCMVTEHRDGKGKSWIIDAGHTYSYVGGKWNDKISSVICEVFCKLRVWEHRDYQGATKVFENSPYVGGGWNDRISSLEASCDAS